MTAVVFLCARCGVPVRMTSLGCYGHLAPQVVGQAKPHAARPQTVQDGRSTRSRRPVPPAGGRAA